MHLSHDHDHFNASWATHQEKSTLLAADTDVSIVYILNFRVATLLRFAFSSKQIFAIMGKVGSNILGVADAQAAQVIASA